MKASNLTHPFWSWNGDIDKKEIKKQLALFKKMGYGGFFIHPRTGLETEYLSKKWFDLIKYCIKESKKLGLIVHFYDEDRYPSGTCGGLVTKDKRFQKKYIRMAVADQFIGEYYDSAIAVFNAEFDGEYLVSYKKYNGESGKVLIFYLDYGEPSSYFNGSPYVDTLSLDATKAFLSSTHEKYKKYCGKSFSKTAFGMFTDEVGYGHVFCDTLKYNLTQNKQIPFTFGLFEKFIDAYGYDLKERLPELFFIKRGSPIRKIAWQYINLLQELFIENFAKPYYDWCNDNGLKFTGHILQEETLSTQTACCGSAMRFYEYMHFPGIDDLRENSKNEWKIKQLVSVKKQLNKEHAIAECYGATGYNVTIERYKKMSDALSVFGVTMKVPHMAWYTMKGRIKRDYPSNLFYQTCGYEHARTLETYFDNLNKYILSGDDLTEILVISPIESVWAMAHQNAFLDDAFDAKDENIKALEKQFENTFYALLGANIDFDYADEGIILKHCEIADEKDGVKFKIGNKKYRAVALYENIILRKSTYLLLKEFASKGGKVYYNAKNLKLIDFESADNFDLTAFNKVDSLDQLTTNLKQDACFKIYSHESLVFNTRIVNGDYYLFAVNIEREKDLGEVEIAVDGQFSACEVELFADKLLYINSDLSNGKTTVYTTFSKGQSRLFKLTKKPAEVEREKKFILQEMAIPDSFKYALSADNVLLMDFARYYIDEKDLGEDYLLTIDGKLRAKFSLEQKKELMCQPYYKKRTEPDYEKALCDLKLEFTFYCEFIPEEISLAIEQSEKFELFLNGKAVQKVPCGFWVDNCFTKLRLPKTYLVKGKNTLTLSCKYSDPVNIENVYLLGAFGVKDDLKTIVELPETLYIGNVTKQGLPFYSDKITYLLDVPKKAPLIVAFNGENGYHQGVKLNDKTLSASFYPYRTEEFTLGENEQLKIEICLSRQNTFGPIHNKDAKTLDWNGPFAFVNFNTGNFSVQPILTEQGLLIKPTVFEVENQE